MTLPEMNKISDVVWELPMSYRKDMNVPVRIFASEKLMQSMDQGVFDQAANVASMPKLAGPIFINADSHVGYGVPIGGVMASPAEDGIISPGAIGFDINCGMRLMRTNLTEDDVRPKLKELVDTLFRSVGTGVGSKGKQLSVGELCEVMTKGIDWCIENGYARKEDAERCEENGRMDGANAEDVSERAIKRGKLQLGSLGSGNHYLEIQVVDEDMIEDKELAEKLGLFPGQVVVMHHCGSRGLGHQIATDYLKKFVDETMPEHGISVPDRELACGPFNSDDGQAYFSAMKCAVNFAFANRQMITDKVRKDISKVFGKSEKELGLELIYDVAHNIAKVEKHKIEGKNRDVIVHRKGATRSFGPSRMKHPLFSEIGQPVILGGSMETGSWLLVGNDESDNALGSTAHGAGRAMSRSQARKQVDGESLRDDMEKRGIYIRSASYSGLAEEAGLAYKDVNEVVDTCIRAGLNRPVVALRPIGNIKG